MKKILIGSIVLNVLLIAFCFLNFVEPGKVSSFLPEYEVSETNFPLRLYGHKERWSGGVYWTLSSEVPDKDGDVPVYEYLGVKTLKINKTIE